MRKIKKPVIEVERIEVVSRFTRRYETWCRGCGETVELVKLDEAAALAGTSADKVIERAAGGAIHLGIRPEALLFCVKSLLAGSAVASGAKIQWN